MRNNCGKCRYCFKVKQLMRGSITSGGKWKTASVCCVFPITEGKTSGYEAFALIVDKDNDICEMFNERIINKNEV